MENKNVEHRNMEHKNIENKVKSAFENATPDIYDTIASDIKNSKGKVIPMMKKRNNRITRGVAIAAAFALVVAGAFALNNISKKDEIISVVSLDVNPGIEIQLKKDNVVKEVVALNEDGKKIVDNMDFEGSKLEVALNALVGSMVKNGYLSDMANSILVSVEGKDEAKNTELQNWVSAEIEKILGGSNLSGAVLSQTVTENEELKNLADVYGISLGKARLISEIAKKNTQYKVEDLAGLSINELNLLSEGKGHHVEHVTASGTASSKGYIGEEKAIGIAFEHAGVAEADTYPNAYAEVQYDLNVEAELDMEDGVMVYEVDFQTAEYEYEYEIDAKTGKILNSHKEPRELDDMQDDDLDDIYDDDDHDDDWDGDDMALQAPASDIGREKAKNIALNHAGVSAADARDIEVELDRENGVTVYEVSFDAANYDYDYEIHAETGAVLQARKERD